MRPRSNPQCGKAPRRQAAITTRATIAPKQRILLWPDDARHAEFRFGLHEGETSSPFRPFPRPEHSAKKAVLAGPPITVEPTEAVDGSVDGDGVFLRHSEDEAEKTGYRK